MPQLTPNPPDSPGPVLVLRGRGGSHQPALGSVNKREPRAGAEQGAGAWRDKGAYPGHDECPGLMTPEGGQSSSSLESHPHPTGFHCAAPASHPCLPHRCPGWPTCFQGGVIPTWPRRAPRTTSSSNTGRSPCSHGLPRSGAATPGGRHPWETWREAPGGAGGGGGRRHPLHLLG